MIVEGSDIIRRGLSVLLVDKNNTPLFVEDCGDNGDFLQSFLQSKPKIVIGSPSVFDRYEKQIKSLKEQYNTLSVALIYSYQHPEKLSGFDALLYLDDNAESIQSTINGLLNNQQETVSAEKEESLTEREKEVLRLLVSGYTTKKIADTLFISVHTVNAHRKNIMRKLDIKTVSGLTIYAVLNNIITLKED